MEAAFTGLTNYLGYSDKSSPFLMVPFRGLGLLLLNKGKGFRVRPADSRLKLNELSKKEVSPTLREFLAQYRRTDESEDLFKELWGISQRCIEFGWRMFSVKGAGKGFTSVKAANGRTDLKVEVAICERKSFKVAFRFLRHKQDSGRLEPATTWKPEDAAGMVRMVNDIFAPQVNIYFHLEDTDWCTTQPLHQPIGDAAFQHYIVQHKSDKTDVTVFLAGKWKGKDTHPNGTYYSDHKVAVVADKPQHVEGTDGDSFALTLSHELAHFVQHGRKLMGHHDRDKVLLSRKVQSPLLDKQLVADLNPW